MDPPHRPSGFAVAVDLDQIDPIRFGIKMTHRGRRPTVAINSVAPQDRRRIGMVATGQRDNVVEVQRSLHQRRGRRRGAVGEERSEKSGRGGAA